MTTQTKDAKQAVSAERAAHMIENLAYGGQRKLARMRVAQLRRHIREGTFLKNSQIDVCVAEDTGQEWFINGYHRLTAQVEEGVTISYYIRVIQVPTASDVNAIYSIIDRIMGSRTTANIINNRTDLPGEYSAKLRTSMFRGLQWIGREVEDIPEMLDGDIVRLWAEYENARDALGHELDRGFERMNATMFRRMCGSAMMGIALYTTHREPKAATFWGDCVEVKPGWPNLLANYLMHAPSRTKRSPRKEQASALNTYMLVSAGTEPTEAEKKGGLGQSWRIVRKRTSEPMFIDLMAALGGKAAKRPDHEE